MGPNARQRSVQTPAKNKIAADVHIVVINHGLTFKKSTIDIFIPKMSLSRPAPLSDVPRSPLPRPPLCRTRSKNMSDVMSFVSSEVVMKLEKYVTEHSSILFYNVDSFSTIKFARNPHNKHCFWLQSMSLHLYTHVRVVRRTEFRSLDESCPYKWYDFPCMQMRF